MIKRSIVIVCLIILQLLYLSACSDEKEVVEHTDISKTKDLEVKVLIDQLDDPSIRASIYFDRDAVGGGLESKTYYWKDGEVTNSDTEYQFTYANVYPERSFEQLQKKLKLSQSPLDEYGQLYFYGNTEQFELFIFDSSRNNEPEWKLFVDRGSEEVQNIVIEKELDEVRLDSYQIEGDAVYLYTRATIDIDSDIVIYRIQLSDEQVEKIVIPFEELQVKDLVVKLDQVFIKDNIFFLATSEFDIGGSSDEGILFQYDLVTKEARRASEKDIPQKSFPYEGGYLILFTEQDTYKTYLKFYDSELNVLKQSEYVKVNPEYGPILIRPRDHFFYLHDNKLYGSMGYDGKYTEYLIVIDVPTTDIVYLAEIQNNLKGYAKQDVRFHSDQDGEMINMDSF